MKYLLLCLLFASRAHACSRLADLISLYNSKDYSAAYMEMKNRCGDQRSWDAHESYWEGKICEAYGNTTQAINSFEFVLKLKYIEDPQSDKNMLFYQTKYYPDSIYRLAKIYRKLGNKKDYAFMAKELKKIDLDYYYKLGFHVTQIDKDAIKKEVNTNMLSEGDVVVGIKIMGDYAVVMTDSKFDGSTPTPSPMYRYFLKHIKNKWEIIQTSPEVTTWEHDGEKIPQALYDFNTYTERK